MNTKLLKQKILDLAIRGKLTQQLKSDGNTADLLKEISSTCHPERSAKGAKSKDLKQIIPLDKSEAPFEIPANWEWVRLGDIARVTTGKTPLKTEKKFYDEGTIPWVTSSLTSYDYIDKVNVLITEYAVNQCSLLVYPPGTLVLAMYGEGKTRGQISELMVSATINQACAAIEIFCKEKVFKQFIKYFHNWNYERIREGASGSTQPNLNLNIVQSMMVPLPPLAEQQRIVEKIQEAFAEIDSIENNKELLKTHIKQARQKILDLAIHGKLVPQNKADEPASVLLERITSDNPHYEKLTDIPFEIPDSWEWVKLGDVCDDFIVPQRDKPTEFNGNIPWCRIEDIEGKYLNGSKSQQLVTKQLADKMNMHLCPKGTVISACSASIGNQAITTVECYTNQTFIGIVCNCALFNEYLYYFLTSQNKTLKEMGKGTTIGYISRKKYEDFLLPLPPLAEQKRIVDKIEEIFASLDEISLHLV